MSPALRIRHLSILTLDRRQLVSQLRLAGLERLVRQTEAFEARWEHLVVLRDFDAPCADPFGQDIGDMHGPSEGEGGTSPRRRAMRQGEMR